jgi:His-Xaa-Ser system protein HxsD
MERVIKFQKELYSKESLLQAIYALQEKADFRLSADAAQFTVFVSPRSGYAGCIKQIIKEFNNVLLFASLRKEVSQSNRALREYIMTRALVSAAISSDDALSAPGAIASGRKRKSACDDPYGIGLSWEDVYGKGKKSVVQKRKRRAQ